jgi:hypothetical protein
MTPAEEATFIALWQQGASQQELAARLGGAHRDGQIPGFGPRASGQDPGPAQGRAYPRQRHGVHD